MPTSPTTLTLKHLRAAGWPLVEVVEHWNPHARIRQDLFGFVDVLAVGPAGVLAVQTTSAGNVSARIRKIADSPHINAVREAGWAVHVHGWALIQRDGTICDHDYTRCGCRWTLHRDVDVS